MGLLDIAKPRALTFTVTLADGTTWTPPSGQRYWYSIDAGVLTVFPINGEGEHPPGTRRFNPLRWAEVIIEDEPAAPVESGAISR